MTAFLSHVPIGAWVLTAIVAWLIGGTIHLAVWCAIDKSIEKISGDEFCGFLFFNFSLWPLLLTFIATHYLATRFAECMNHNRECPKCKSKW